MNNYFYAKVASDNNMVVAFPTEAERDEWVSEGSNLGNYHRLAITERQAKYIIKTAKLKLVKDPADGGVIVYQPTNPSAVEKVVVYQKDDVKLDPKSIPAGARKMTAETIMKNAITIGNKQLCWIPVDLLNVEKYQRRLENHVYKIAREWDDAKCNVLLVSYDKQNGWFNVIDGQHRAIAARMRDVEYLVCELFTGMTTSTEAARFTQENTNAKKLSPFDTYKANQYVSDDDDTEQSRIDKQIAVVCNEFLIPVEKSTKSGVLKSVVQARKIMKCEGAECLRFIFKLIQDINWDAYSNGYSYIVVETFRKIWIKHREDGKLDSTRQILCAMLQRLSPDEVEAMSNKEFPELGRLPRWSAIIEQIIK